MKLSVIIPTHNDTEQLNATLVSLYKHTPLGVVGEIIIVDDFSDIPYQPCGALGQITLYRFTSNQGPAAAREYGSSVARGDWLLHCDSHMIFHDGWYDRLLWHVEREGEEKLLCGTYVTLDKSDHKVLNVGGGARLEFYDLRGGGPRMLEMEPTIEEVAMAGRTLAETAIQGAYRVPCSVGAFYCFHRHTYNELKGLLGLNGWGCEEALMSLKYYLSGRSVKVMPDVRVGHIWQHQILGFQTVVMVPRPAEWRVLYNKLVTLWQTCGEDICYDFLTYVTHPYVSRVKEELFLRREDHRRIRKQLEEKVFVRDIDWYCNEFGVAHPADIKVNLLR